MTIVTKNSLTLSNVNDGTITHYAYAYSADGTDGFYIGGATNLLQGTQDFSGSNWLNLGSSWIKTDETYNGLSVVETTSDWNGIAQYYQVKQGETYTFSLFARYTSGTGTSNFYISLNSDPESGHKNAQVNNGTLACSLDTNWKKCSITFTATTDGYVKPRMERTNNNTNVLRVCGLMFEKGTVAHPWSPAPSEAHPSYIGQYTDFNTTASTDPTKYAPWIIFKGNDGKDGKDGVNGKDGIAGKDGVGLTSTSITYAQSTSGTVVPSSGWTSSVPAVPAGQFLWTRTIWSYTDGTNETGYSVAKAGDMGKSVWSYPYDRGANRLGNWWSDLKPTPTTDNPPKVGDTIIDLVGNIYQITNVVIDTTQGGGGLFDYGPILTSVKGADGDPGKIVSDTEPSTRFKGLTWKYSGTTDLTASDGTVIKPNIEYYFNGSKWVISLVEAKQINADTLAAISAYLGHVYAAIVEDKQSDGSGFLLDSEKQLLRVNKTANTYNQIFSEGLTTFAKISDLPGIGNIIPGANYISAILAGNFLQFGQYSTAVDSNGVPVGGVSVGEGSISFGQTTSGSYGFTLTGDLTVAGNIKSLKDTDWIDIPPASGWGGTMRYMIAEGKFYLRLTGVTNPAVSATTAKTMCTIPTTAVPLGGIRGIPIMSYGQPIAELVINANGTIQFYSHDAVGTGHSLHVFVQGIPLT